MRVLIGLLFLLPASGWASPFVCFTGKSIATVETPDASVYASAFAEDDPYDHDATYLLAKWNPSCEAVERVETGLKATSLILSGTGFGLACTGIGLPATVWLQGASIGTSVLGLIVGQLPCDNRTRDAEIKVMAESAVCDELAKQGITCSLR